ncbi:uncharacterized protein LOC100908313 [Galendromus occidentalis]|uniref:Uncharacterized protein LOC100908313 n=1 Tax=Galendromus occidentalis TaxID=34638 RepID=A0AAJ6QR87_9ACAR|nr:uncharacterized protein LOC100908313 [Galendromus occidentalis]
MDLEDVKSLTESQISKKLGDIRASVPVENLSRVVEWTTKVPKTHPKLFGEAAAALGRILEQNTDSDVSEKVMMFFKNNLNKCEGAWVEHFIFISFIALSQENNALDGIVCEILETARKAAAKSDDNSQVMTSLLKTRIVPKLKEMAEAKNYKKAFAVWRAIVRSTKLKITSSITNDVLQIATMAFKENNPEYHALAFKSWKILIENLPQEVLRKPAYIRLVLNPLNRTYRDTDANSTLQKYIAWWQHVVSLGEDAEVHSDDVVVPLLQKAFCLPSAKARQLNPTAFANPTRIIPQCAYTVLVFLWFDGNPELRRELQQLGQPNFKLNENFIKTSCLAKHSGVFEEAISLIVNNITQKVAPPPRNYSTLFCRVLLSRVASFHENGHHDMVRSILSAVYGILQTKLDIDQSLRIFQCLSDALPPEVMSSPQFNFRQGSSSKDEFPELTFASLYVRQVANLCRAAGDESLRTKFRPGLRRLLERGNRNMSTPRFSGLLMVSLQDAESLQAESWQEVSAFLSSQLRQSKVVTLEEDLRTFSHALALPISSKFPLTEAVSKEWIELHGALMQSSSRGEDFDPNRFIADICGRIHEKLSDSHHDLNHLLLISQMFESVVDHCVLESTPTPRPEPLGDLEPLVRCVISLIRKGCEQLTPERQSRAPCQFYVNVVEMVHILVRDSRSPVLCEEIIVRLVPELVPIFKKTAVKSIFRNSPLFHVESALLTALDHVLYALKKRSAELPKEGPVLEIIRLVVKESLNHWKASINDTAHELAELLSLDLPNETASKRTSNSPIKTPASSPRPSPSTKAPQEPDRQPERKWTRSTPDASTLRNGNAREKGSLKANLPSKRKSKPTAEEEFVHISAAKKKSVIYTEHQLEKLKEQKIIPSMYEDLSQSSQGTLMGPPSKSPEDGGSAPAEQVSPTATAASNGSTNNGNGKPPTRESARKSLQSSRKPSPRKVVEPSSSDDNSELGFTESSPEASPGDGVGTLVVGGRNRKDKESSSADVRTDDKVPGLGAPSRRISELPSSSEQIDENADKPRGAQKRKLARPSQSPMTTKLRPMRLSSTLSRTKSRRSQAKSSTGEQSVGMDSDSVADVDVKLETSKKTALPESYASSSDNGLDQLTKAKKKPAKLETKQRPSISKVGAAGKLSRDAPSSPDLPQQTIVDRIKAAAGAQREDLLKFISSPEFLQRMTREERKSFLKTFLNNVTEYIL